MSPLFLVNWHRVAVRFRGLMWLIALALAVVIIVKSAPQRGESHASPPVAPLVGHHHATP